MDQRRRIVSFILSAEKWTHFGRLAGAAAWAGATKLIVRAYVF